MSVSLPDTKYFMVMWKILENFGGVTSMCLKRAKNMRTYAGVHAPIISFDTKPDYAASVASLVEKGYLTKDMEVINIWEYYRHSSMAGPSNTTSIPTTVRPWDAPLPNYLGSETTEIIDSDGNLFARIIKKNDSILHRKYYRPDGSVFFVDTVEVDNKGGSKSRNVWLIDPHGDIAGYFTGAAQFYGHWLNELTGGQRATFIFDDKFAAKILRSFSEPHTLSIVPIHSRHASEPIRGNLSSNRLEILTESSRWDGLVFLTERQKTDYVERFGRSSNIFVVPNPSERIGQLPQSGTRMIHRGVMIANLQKVKNISAALDIIELASRRVPDVLLDIYGTGPLGRELQEKIVRRGLERNVVLHGYKSHAAQEYLTASFSLFTSKFEGQPLSLMESMGHGCPPVAFDFRYGPSDLFIDGESGFLVPEGDVEAAAARVEMLCNQPETVDFVGKNAWSEVGKFENEPVLRQWADVIETAWRQKPEKLKLRNFVLVVTDISNGGSFGSSIAGKIAWHTNSGELAHENMDMRIQLVGEEAGPPVDLPALVTNRNIECISFLTQISERLLAQARTNRDKLQSVDVFLIATARNVSVRLRLARHDGLIWRDTTSL